LTNDLTDRETAEKLYYLSPHVRSRIMEFCGCSGEGSGCTARFLVGNGHTVLGYGIPGKEDIRETAQMGQILDEGRDIFRSLWDREYLMASLDLDYQNEDYADEAFYNPGAAFGKLEPVFACIGRILRGYGVGYLAVMTGQGYHLSWKISQDSLVHEKLENLAGWPPSLLAKYRHDHPLTPETIPLAKGKAHSGLGMLLEFLTFKILAECSAMAGIPVVFTGLPVGNQNVGRESISVDLSAHGDPLYLRYFRCAFSLYHKFDGSAGVGPLICLPRFEEPLAEMLERRKSLLEAARLAARTAAAIPDSTAGSTRILEEYLSSPLRQIHEHFYSGWHDDPRDWGLLYDRLNLSEFSPCVARPLSYPNDALLKPANIQNVTRVLVSQGWHPRSVAGLIRSRYERDHHWGINWMLYDAANRADFYVRSFYAMAAVGVDDLRDFNCVSHQEKGYCPQPWCGHNLADYRDRLKEILPRK